MKGGRDGSGNPERKKNKIGDEKNRDAKVLQWFHGILNDGGMVSHCYSNFSDYNSHREIDEVNVLKKLRTSAARPVIR